MRIAEYVAGKADEIEAFIGLKPKALVIFALSAAGVAVVATVLYWGAFGFSHWRNEMSVAGKIMVAAATVPARAGAQCGQYVCPVHGAVGLPRFNAAGTPLCPVGGEVMQFRTLGAGQVSPAAFAAG